mmetsp:Transcript_31877/g.95417  ORF Transcript_31877/g.95417 Transcript_31877/m.95417 type:complete len:285 (-) Transcript_31877:3539-4393(-)
MVGLALAPRTSTNTSSRDPAWDLPMGPSAQLSLPAAEVSRGAGIGSPVRTYVTFRPSTTSSDLSLVTTARTPMPWHVLAPGTTTRTGAATVVSSSTRGGSTAAWVVEAEAMPQEARQEDGTSASRALTPRVVSSDVQARAARPMAAPPTATSPTAGLRHRTSARLLLPSPLPGRPRPRPTTGYPPPLSRGSHTSSTSRCCTSRIRASLTHRVSGRHIRSGARPRLEPRRRPMHRTCRGRRVHGCCPIMSAGISCSRRGKRRRRRRGRGRLACRLTAARAWARAI